MVTCWPYMMVNGPLSQIVTEAVVAVKETEEEN